MTEAIKKPEEAERDYRSSAFQKVYSDEVIAAFFEEYKRNGQVLQTAARKAGVAPGTARYWLKKAERKNSPTVALVTEEQVKEGMDAALDRLGMKLINLASNKANKATIPELLDGVEKIAKMRKLVKAGKKAEPQTQEDAEVNDAHDKAMDILKTAQQRLSLVRNSGPGEEQDSEGETNVQAE